MSDQDQPLQILLPTPTNTTKEDTILEGSRFGVACATMVYMYADLRLLSATGYACTPFERLRVGSDDYVGRIEAGFLRECTWKRKSGCNMLLSLLQELRQEAALYRDSSQECAAAPMVYLPEPPSQQKRRRSSIILSQPSILMSPPSIIEQRLTSRPKNVVLETIEGMLQASLIEEPESRYAKNQPLAPHTQTGCCLKLNFELEYSQLLLHNLYRDAIKEGILNEDGLPNTDDENDAIDGTTTDGALWLLDQAISHQDPRVLKILAQQFTSHSIASQLLTTQTELVWFHDYFPSHEIVFGILLDHTHQQIQVVFRGTVTIENWISNLDFWGVQVDNPVEDEYPNKQSTFYLHNGFQSYILRERRDTQKPWWKTLCDLVHHFGQVHFKGKYQLVVSGHSLGGACGTIFGLWASTDERMTNNGNAVIVQTFAAPMVGDHAFGDAFRHQEKVGKLRHARFYNRYDMVPHLPLNFKVGWHPRGSPWVHTGIGIELSEQQTYASWSVLGVLERIIYSLWGRWRSSATPPCAVNIHYADRKGYWASAWEAFCHNILWHADLVNSGRNHDMGEYHHRLEQAMAYDGGGCLSHQTMEMLYEKHATKGTEWSHGISRARAKSIRTRAKIINAVVRMLMGRFE